MQMPAIGLGTYGGVDAATVATAIALGYRLIDTAAVYNNERQVGEGIRASSIDRRELFVTTKLHMDYYGAGTRAAFDASLRKLGLNYVDLYLIHWPVWRSFGPTVESWKTMAKLRDEGRIRAIGVSNFTVEHIQALHRETGITPAVNQVELHPMFNQGGLRAFAKTNGIVIQAWSPLGGTRGQPLAHPVVTGIAAKHGKTPAQVVLRWHVENGLSAVPKSIRSERLAENIDVFGFALTAEEVAAIDGLETNERSTPHPDVVDTNTWGAKVFA